MATGSPLEESVPDALSCLTDFTNIYIWNKHEY